MGRNTRRRPTGARRATSAAIALILGGGGLVAVNVYASATEAGPDGTGASSAWPTGAATIDCPDVGSRLTEVPEQAKGDVDGELAALDEQIADAYKKLQDAAGAARQDGGAAADPDGTIVQPLEKRRAGTIERIAAAIDRVGDRPQGLDALADCSLRGAEPAGEAGQDVRDAVGDGQGDEGDQGDQAGEEGGGEAGQPPDNGGQAGNGPVAADYADITTVQPGAAAQGGQEQDASRGTFSTECGVNANGLFNSDNVIAAPGVSNGAHHFHDYIGNQATNAFSDDEQLVGADTSCADEGDKSAYYWPVLRLQNGKQEQDAAAPGGGIEGNAGEIVTPEDVTLTFVGSPRGEVTAMPRLLRIITGDAKAFVNGTANANASWSCTGFEDRQLKDKYPLCPDGSDVVRTFRFQSCWDGRNIDSANHRTHVAFAAADGTCPEGFRAIPQLVQRIVYDVDRPSVEDGGRTTPLFAVDSFPEQLHKPVTDHGDFINVFDENLMREMVDCINEGRECGPDAAPQEPGDGAGEESPEPTEEPGEPTDTPTTAPESPTAAPEAPQDGNGDEGGEDQGGGTDQGEGKDQGNGKEEQGDEAGQEDGAGQDGGQGGGDAGEQTAGPAERSDLTRAPGATADPVRPTGDAVPRAVTTAPDPARSGTTGDNGGEAAASAPAGGVTSSAPARTAPQAQGGLADTGAGLGLWPAAAGGVLLAAGCVLLVRTRRRAM
ncbi:DUF1996 domain-containing protein [Streptomyces sp. DH24]|uniref:DUF1996 domain-containing protein n=1 Tax=Streptomyces sp. DH24 TaxID=3040123 RepID=UPI0024414DD7|nr:DUF1996 domain-containing protein [Streptomyces sp. DH24]MDG9720442.1 DUF1996 domain-containing protein [Streptomyces sp. DH24]